MRNIDSTLTGQIITIVCEAWGVSRPDLVGRSRRRPLPWARAMLCEYLRIYAGHDTVSCSAILHMTPEGVVCYSTRYTYLKRTYKSFDERDNQIRTSIKSLLKSQS